jgi:hypothetical protein
MNFPHTFFVFAYLAAKHQIWLTVNSGYVVTSVISPGPQSQSFNAFWFNIPSGIILSPADIIHPDLSSPTPRTYVPCTLPPRAGQRGSRPGRMLK